MNMHHKETTLDNIFFFDLFKERSRKKCPGYTLLLLWNATRYALWKMERKKNLFDLLNATS